MSNNKRVCYVGNFSSAYTTENDVRKAFEALGWTVIALQENKTSIQQVKSHALQSNLLLITGTWADVFNINEWLDLVHDLAENNIPSATLHLDTFWGKSRGGRKWWREPMFNTAYIFTADGDYQKEWELLGKNHIWLPPAVRHDAVKVGTPKEEYRNDVAFIGSNGQGYHEDVWGYRKELVDNLRDMAKQNGWQFKNIGGDLPKVDRNDDMNNFYASSLVTVGDSLCLKKEHSHYWSDRVPEALGRGGFLIMPRIDALEEYGWEIPTYEWGDWRDLEDKIKFWLASDVDRVLIQKRNLEYVKDNETYINRVQRILEMIGLDDDSNKL